MSSRNELPIFRKRLRIVIADSNMQIYQFAKHIDVNYDTLRKWLHGDRVPVATNLKKICEACDVSADWLLGLGE